MATSSTAYIVSENELNKLLSLMESGMGRGLAFKTVFGGNHERASMNISKHSRYRAMAERKVRERSLKNKLVKPITNYEGSNYAPTNGGKL